MLRSLVTASMLGIVITAATAQSVVAPKRESPAARLDINQLESRLRNLSAGDRSVIIHSASSPGAVMTTSPGSPNDLLWSEMEAVGWTKRVSIFEKSPDASQIAHLIRTFALTEEGAKAVKTVISRVQAR